MSFLKYDNEHTRVCICQDCGRKFVYGAEADNEKYCLRCEREAFLEAQDDQEFCDSGNEE